MKYGKKVLVSEGDESRQPQEVAIAEFESVTETYIPGVPAPLEREMTDAQQTQEAGGSRWKWFSIGKACIYGLFILLPLLFFPLTTAPVEITKTVTTLVLLALAFVAYVVDTIDKRTVRYPRAWVTTAVVGWVVVVGVSAFVSKTVSVSLYGNLLQPDSFLAFGLYAIGFLLTFYFLDRGDARPLGIYMSVALAVVIAITSLQFFNLSIIPWDFARQIGFNTVGSISALGVFLATAFMVCIAAIYRRRSFGLFQQFLLVLSISLLILIALLKQPLLWMGIGVIILVAAGLEFVANRKIGFLLALVSTCLFFIFIDGYLPRLATVPTEITPSITNSFAVAKSVVMSPRALFGYGPATYPFAFSLYQIIDPAQIGLLSYTFLQGNNFLITILTTTGVLGLLSFLVALLVAGYRIARSMDDEYVAIIGSGLLFLTISLFFFPASFVQLFFLFAGTGLVLKIAGNHGAFSFSRISRGYLFILFVIGISIIAGAMSGVYFIGRKYIASVYYGKSVQAFAASNLSEGFVKLDRAVNFDNTNDTYWRTGSQALLLQARQVLSQNQGSTAAQTQIQAIVARAVQSAQTATQLNPFNSLNWSNLGSIYENLIAIAGGADEQAFAAYKKAMEFNPKNPQEPVNLARALLTSALVLESAQGGSQKQVAQDRLKQALEALKISESIDKDYAPANFSLIQLYIKQGETQKAVQKIQDIQATSPLDAGLAYQLGLIAYQNKELDIARAQFERAVSLFPDYSNAIYFLGLTYDAKGLKAQARAAFERLAELNPDNEEIKNILKNYSSVQAPVSNTTTTPEKKN